MRRLVLVTVVALGFTGSARAAVPNPDARAFLVMNAATGEVLASHNADESMPIASITKLMTVLIALKHLKPTDVVTVSDEAAQVGESRIPLTPGERVTVADLLAGALIQSANNAADALASAASHGDVKRFVGWMNARARVLGLRDTHFTRPDGLDAPGHVSSARDVAVLAQVLAGAQQDRNLAAAAQHALSLWIVEIEATLARLLNGSPIAAVASAEGLARGIAASFIGIELFEGVDPEGAESAMASLETLGVLVEVVEDLGPVARRALRARLRRTGRASATTLTS